MDQMRYAICSVEDIPMAAPRYRMGKNRTPQEIPMGKGVKKVPTFAESLLAQDDRMDREDEKQMGGGRNTRPRWLQDRIRHRSRMT